MSNDRSAGEAAEKKVDIVGLWGAPPPLHPINEYCRQHISKFVDFVSIEPIGQGFSNPTYRLLNSHGELQILRAMPPRRSTKSAHRIDREYEVLSALQRSTVPVPKPIHYCAEIEPAGTAFYLMEYVQGPVFTGNALPEDPLARRRIILALAECLGHLHSTNYRALGLSRFGAHSGTSYVARQIASMTKLYRESEMGRIVEMEELISLLCGFDPKESDVCLIHGDYRLGNVVVQPDLQGIAAILDWELSTLGDPLTDVAYCLLMYHWDSPVFGMIQSETEGVPSEHEFLEAYCKAAKRSSTPELALYGAFSLFRLACITQAALRREAGNAIVKALSPAQYPAAIARKALSFVERSK